ncbi:hypothetical protein MINS_31530 [Mycolicibacterium insubricum]|nr:hypothetical protein MINS_31530 [Mycolicibacterium insubricum]
MTQVPSIAQSPAESIPCLNVKLLGDPEFRCSTGPLTLSTSCRAILANLVLQDGHRSKRSRLMLDIAPDAAPGSARRRLNTAVWRLKRAVDPAAHALPLVLSDAHSVSINPHYHVVSDVSDFEAACDRSHSSVQQWGEEELGAANTALDLYRGELLSGIADEWVLGRRDQLSELQTQVALQLSQWHRMRHQWQQALHYAEHALATHPLSETLHRLVIGIHLESGQPWHALHHFETCRNVLATELGTAPELATNRLAERVRSTLQTSTPAAASESTRLLDSTIESVMSELADARASLERCRIAVDAATTRLRALRAADRIPPTPQSPVASPAR